MYLKKFNEYADNEFIQFSQLIGKIIDNIYINIDKTILTFLCDDKKYYSYQSHNDCCNQVWYSHLNGIDFIIHQRINKVESKNWKDVDESNYEEQQEYEESYLDTLYQSWMF